MAHTSDPRSRPWAAFLAGAVVMLVIVLVAWAWSRSREAAGALRADVALPAADLLSLPSAPPPQGPRLPRLPLPTPR